MRTVPLLSLVACAFTGVCADSNQQASVAVVLGASGEPAYAETFITAGRKWEAAARKSGAKFQLIQSSNSLSQLRTFLDAEPRSSSSDLWLVLIGHGTPAGKEAKFNLEGEDLSSAELASLLKPFQRRLAVAVCASASAPFIPALSGPDRSIITASRSVSEVNYSRYGGFLASAIDDAESDLDKDGQVSLLEAHLAASKQTEAFYVSEGRLATEHPLMDDNGDRQGTPSDWFRGIRAVKRAQDGSEPDGLRAQQLHLIASESERQLPVETRRQRDALELEIARLRERKPALDPAEYYRSLEELLLKLGELYPRDIPRAQGATQ